MTRIHANNFDTTLTSAISSSDISMTLNSVTGFPAVGSGTTCNVTLEDGGFIEIVKCTAISGSVVTIVRSQEGTTANNFSAGAAVSLRATRDSIDSKQDSLSGLSLTGVTVDVADLVLIQDDSDSNNLKTVTVQSIIDLVSLGSAGTVPTGGTGLTSLTAYAILAGGTTSTGNMQQVAGVGTSGQVLTSNGAGNLPTWQAVSAGSGPLTGITSISDSNSNLSVNITATASAVNYINIINAATGNSPTIRAAGTDTNEYLVLQGKGNRGVVVGGSGLNKLSISSSPGSSGIDIWQGLALDITSVGLGLSTLSTTTTGTNNTAIGFTAGLSLTTGSDNTFIGYDAGFTGSTQSKNVIIGSQSGGSNASGSVNIGNSANENTIIGYRASIDTSSASGCIAIGSNAVATKATGSTSSDHGPGIAIGSAATKAGFRGDGTIYSAVGSSSGYLRVKINGTFYKIQLFADV